MNSIPTIFNQRLINRTVLGGKRFYSQAKMNVTVILINNSSSHLRVHNLETLQKCGFEKIISMELNSANYNLEEFVNKFPCVKFIVPQEKVTDGDLINIGMEETDSEYVLVLKDSIAMSGFILLPTIAQKLMEKNVFCIVPRLSVDKNQSIPNNYIPTAKNGIFKVESVETITDGIPTLYPLDYIGFYNRQKFIQLGGYDYTIENAYWQNLDLAFRAWLWGEKIFLTTTFSLNYLENPPVEDTASNLGQFRFYLKNLTPIFKLDHGEIQNSSFFRLFRHSPCGTVETIRQFNDAKKWVTKNQYRFKTDATKIISEWGSIK